MPSRICIACFCFNKNSHEHSPTKLFLCVLRGKQSVLCLSLSSERREICFLLCFVASTRSSLYQRSAGNSSGEQSDNKRRIAFCSNLVRNVSWPILNLVKLVQFTPSDFPEKRGHVNSYQLKITLFNALDHDNLDKSVENQDALQSGSRFRDRFLDMTLLYPRIKHDFVSLAPPVKQSWKDLVANSNQSMKHHHHHLCEAMQVELPNAFGISWRS